eukprot:TRINITY_DN5476_c0_g3_i1.p2 TRINITY_DN5476_c0_g3~~TRINITY_DN5476_c0_g3_i1.p2  ORF type:complete len:234 (-),score=69.63 TRINITY_DN5476_c0_g3_i1:219-920(-)
MAMAFNFMPRAMQPFDVYELRRTMALEQLAAQAAYNKAEQLAEARAMAMNNHFLPDLRHMQGLPNLPAPVRPPPGLEEVVCKRDFDCNVSTNCSTDNEWDEDIDTVIIKGLPVKITEVEIYSMLKELGFHEDDVSFMNMPKRKRPNNKEINRGCCFIGFQTPALAGRFREVAQGYIMESSSNTKAISVQKSHIQGEVENFSSDVTFGTSADMDRVTSIDDIYHSATVLARLSL